MMSKKVRFPPLGPLFGKKNKEDGMSVCSLLQV